MNKVKPIFIVGLPNSCNEEVDYLSADLSKKLEDYHILAYGHDGDDVKFEAFYEKDFNEVKFNELKEIVKGYDKIHNKNDNEEGA